MSGSYEQDWSAMETLFKEIKCNYIIRRNVRLNKKGILNKSSVFEINRKQSTYNFLSYIYLNRKTDMVGLNRKYDKWIQKREQFTKKYLRKRIVINQNEIYLILESLGYKIIS